MKPVFIQLTNAASHLYSINNIEYSSLFLLHRCICFGALTERNIKRAKRSSQMCEKKNDAKHQHTYLADIIYERKRLWSMRKGDGEKNIINSKLQVLVSFLCKTIFVFVFLHF